MNTTDLTNLPLKIGDYVQSIFLRLGIDSKATGWLMLGAGALLIAHMVKGGKTGEADNASE